MELDVFHLFLWEPIAFADTPFEINRVVLLMYVGALLCVGFFLLGLRRRELVPRGLQTVVETGYLFVKNSIAIDVIGPQGVKYANFLATLFFFIFFSNLLEIVPGINFPVTSRMAIPALLALLSWIVFNFVGIRNHGWRYFKETLFPPGVPKAIYIILTPIELFSVFVIRPLTLAIRLFANMLAGHVLLTVFFLFTEDLLLHAAPALKPLGIVTFIVACLLVLFELMVITIQAYIFTTLTAFYIAEALHGHGEHEEVTHHEVGHEVELGTATVATA
jgi:F-type H+-transporting ATPase subunit a